MKRGISATMPYDSIVLGKSILFQGLSHSELEHAFAFFHAEEALYKKGDYLLRLGERVNRFGLVLRGTVQVSMDDLNGNRIIMANVSPGGTFGESHCYLQTQESPINIVAGSDCHILWLATSGLQQPNHEDAIFLQRFIAMLANRTLEMNDRIQILSKRTLRSKLVTFFSLLIKRYDDDSFAIPFDRSAMADYLGTDRSALSRELSHMQAEGLLRFRHNRFEILNAHHWHD